MTAAEPQWNLVIIILLALTVAGSILFWRRL
jgi:hypothetical protein